MNEINPIDYLTRIQQAKFKKAVFPILLVIFSFILNYFFQFDQIKFVALLGLVWYIFTIFQFKTAKTAPVENAGNCLISPLSGRISEINEAQIIIKKSNFDPVDIRCASLDANISLEWTKAPIMFETDCSTPAKLVGYVSGKTACKISFPDFYKLEVELGQKVVAGDILLHKKEEYGKVDN